MIARNLIGSLAAALLVALAFVPAGSASTLQAASFDECSGTYDSSCMHCHADGVCISCNNNGGYIDLGVKGIGHLAGNHCWHGTA